MGIADVVKQFARKYGIEIMRYRPAGRRRVSLLAEHQIQMVLDVGANRGQYATELRAYGFAGHIVSFEPLRGPFALLAAAAAADDRWTAHNMALSDRAGTRKINVAENTVSSSLLNMHPLYGEIAPSAAIVGTETVILARADDVELPALRPMMLKLDVQGHELAVLKGAEGILEDVALVEAEVTIRELYAGQPLLTDVLSFMSARGYDLIALEPAFLDPRDGSMLQYDAFFLARG